MDLPMFLIILLIYYLNPEYKKNQKENIEIIFMLMEKPIIKLAKKQLYIYQKIIIMEKIYG